MFFLKKRRTNEGVSLYPIQPNIQITKPSSLIKDQLRSQLLFMKSDKYNLFDNWSRDRGEAGLPDNEFLSYQIPKQLEFCFNIQ